jgi:hypothetical protein
MVGKNEFSLVGDGPVPRDGARRDRVFLRDTPALHSLTRCAFRKRHLAVGQILRGSSNGDWRKCYMAEDGVVKRRGGKQRLRGLPCLSSPVGLELQRN